MIRCTVSFHAMKSMTYSSAKQGIFGQDVCESPALAAGLEQCMQQVCDTTGDTGNTTSM